MVQHKKQSVRQMIWLAMIISQLVITAVGFVLHEKRVEASTPVADVTSGMTPSGGLDNSMGGGAVAEFQLPPPVQTAAPNPVFEKIFIGFALVCAVLIFALPPVLARSMKVKGSTTEQIDFLSMIFRLALCEYIVISGFILVNLGFSLSQMLPFSVAGILGSLMVYPRPIVTHRV